MFYICYISLIFSLLISNTLSASCTHKILVLDTNKNPIENVFLLSDNKLFGIVSNKNGELLLDSSSIIIKSNYKVSHFNYISANFPNSWEAIKLIDTIILTQKVYAIKEIKIYGRNLNFYLKNIYNHINDNYYYSNLYQNCHINSKYTSKYLERIFNSMGIIENNFENTTKNCLYYRDEKMTNKIKDTTLDISSNYITLDNLFSFINPKIFITRLMELNNEKSLTLIEQINSDLDSMKMIKLTIDVKSNVNIGKLEITIAENNYSIVNYKMFSTRLDDFSKYSTIINGKTIDIKIKPDKQYINVIFKPYLNNKWCFQHFESNLSFEVFNHNHEHIISKNTIAISTSNIAQNTKKHKLFNLRKSLFSKNIYEKFT